MPPKRKRCDSCGKSHLVCPECEENTVSIDSVHTEDYPPGGGHISPDFEEFGIFATEDDVLKYAVVCWNCDYREVKKLSVEIE